MMLASAGRYPECDELDDLFIFGPTPRPDANWGFGIAGKDNKVSVACYARLDQIASELQTKYELHPVKASRRDIEARVWSLVHERLFWPTNQSVRSPMMTVALPCFGSGDDIASIRLNN